MQQSPATPLPLDHNRPALSVSELSQMLKHSVESEFEHVRVRGEISGFKRHASSGHYYFSLKDEDAVLDAVCWRATALRLSVKPEDGMEVIVSGKLTTYAARSRYQIVVDAVELAGQGALLKLLEDRRRKLGAEGLFDPARKKKLPYLPAVIGVVTSPSGAVIRDVLHRLADRFPRPVLVWPVPVQGEGAAEKVAAAIRGFNAIREGGALPRPDLLIVARGGGSLEDLWAFNEEIVVRAAAESRIPLIAAIGHETDTTLIDFAADMRAPTPTAAAEMAVPVRTELLAQNLEFGRRLIGCVARVIEERRLRVRALAGQLPDLAAVIGHAQQRLDDWSDRLGNGLQAMLRLRQQQLGRSAARLRRSILDQAVDRGRERVAELASRLPAAAARVVADAGKRLSAHAQLLESCSYQRVLERGFTLVRDRAGYAITSAAEAKPASDVVIRFQDGEAEARIAGVKPKRLKPSRDDDQGSLL